jgi:protein XagA
MKQGVFKGLLVVIVVTMWSSVVFAGAWTAPQGNFYEKFGFNYYYAHQTFDKKGSRISTPNNGKFTDYNLNNYFEYGITNDLTVINSLTYKWLRNEDNTTIATGIGWGDVDLGLRYKLIDSDKFGIVSSQLLVKIPGPYGKYDALPLGNGQFDTELKLQYGRSLYPLIPGYGNVEVGYRWRAQDPSDEIRYLVEFGVDITQALYTRVKLDGTLSVDNGSKLDSSGNPAATNNFDLGKLDVTAGYKITPSWGVEASYVPALYGQNTAAGATYSFAVYFKSP